jgi:hypothetical protein
VKKYIHIQVALVCIVSLATSSCADMAHVSVVNYCHEAWFVISHYKENGVRIIASPRLEVGQVVDIDYRGVSGQSQKFLLMADGYRVSGNRPLGRVTEEIWIYPTSGELTGPKNVYSWAIYCDGDRFWFQSERR